MPGTRYRPPTSPSTAIITAEGHRALKQEFDELWRVRRPEVVAALAAAAAEGDRSENAEYTYRKRQLAEIDRRVRYLSKRLETVRVVVEAPSDPTRIFFGAYVDIEYADSDEVATLRIVGPDETDAQKGWVSIDAPLARALLKRTVDDEVEVSLPVGVRRVCVLAVRYDR
jgi:transcription elongation factor GreB